MVRVVTILLVSFVSAAAMPAAETAKRPNIVVILADDLGFSDLGCYGGQIETPNLDALAADGLRFTQFYNTARCWPTRGALLTGFYAQQIRRDQLPDEPNGNKGDRPSWAHLVPEYLQPHGYRTYHSGKWHIDGEPIDNGFDHSYWLADQDRYFSPRKHSLDGKTLPPVEPGSGYYATTAIADHAIKCLKEHAEAHADRPFFHYLAFTCPHFPLHALADDVAKYRGRFAAGWPTLREARLKTLRDRGIVSCELSAPTPGVAAWDELSAAEREQDEIRMAIHAAMIDRMDREIGRVLDQLRTMGAFDDTVIFFASDNGASAESLVRGDGNDPAAPPGSAKSYLCLEPGGANVSNAPLRRSKIFVHEGGISTPLIVHWSNGLKARGELRHNPGHVIDIAPTVMELCGAAWPTEWKGTPLPSPAGRSLVPAFTTDGSVTRDYLWWCHSGNRAVRVGDWKLVAEKGEPWELFDLGRDRSETKNLATSQPDKVRELSKLWDRLAHEFGTMASQEGPPQRSKRKAKRG